MKCTNIFIVAFSMLLFNFGASGADAPDAVSAEKSEKNNDKVNCPPSEAQTQNVCTGQLAINSGKTATCSLMIDPKFASALQEFVPMCASQAAEAAGYAPTRMVSVSQIGAHACRKTNTEKGTGDSLSRHSTGEALDIESLTLEYGPGKSAITMPLTEAAAQSASQKRFYGAFRVCWNNSVINAAGKNCTCSIAYPPKPGESLPAEPCNDKHKDHMHLSLTCTPRTGVAGC